MKRAILIYLSIISFSSCQKDITDNRPNSGDSTEIKLSIVGSDLTSRGVAREGDGLDIYNTNKVNVLAYSYDESESWSKVPAPTNEFYFSSKLNKFSSQWGFAPNEPQKRFYPSDKKLAFFGYASDLEDLTPDNKPNNNGLSLTNPANGVPSISYTVPFDAENQPDLMAAQRVIDRVSGNVTMVMKHALTRIGIEAFGYGQKISNVLIKGVASEGVLNLNINNSISWDLSTATYDQEYLFGMVRQSVILGDDPFNLLNDDGYLMMLPQTLTPDAELHFMLNDRLVKVPIAKYTDFKPGEKITYRIDLTQEEPVVYIDFGGAILSNCYILNPSNQTEAELRVPINRVNQFWGQAGYETENFTDNVIGDNDKWVVSVLWYDSFDLVTVPDAGGVFLGKATGTGPNDYFTVVVPKGFNMTGNLVVGIAKGETPPVLVEGGTSPIAVDAGNTPISGAGALCLWSWHIWVTDYEPYPIASQIYTGTGGRYQIIPGGKLWQGPARSNSFTLWSENILYPWLLDKVGNDGNSRGDDLWIGNQRMLLDRPIGVRDENYFCPDDYRYYGTTTTADGFEVGADQNTTRCTGNGVMYYQFGRKDPFPADIKLYSLKENKNNEEVKYTETANSVNAKVPVWYSVYNPLRMIRVSAPGQYPDKQNKLGDWSNSTYANSDNESHLWFDPVTVGSPTAKSIFDPSPWGFRVPRVGAFNPAVNHYYTPLISGGSAKEYNPNTAGHENDKRNNMSVPYTMYYVLDGVGGTGSEVSIPFYPWGSRFWRTGLWNDAQGYNGQFWMSYTIPGTTGWDYYFLFSPNEAPETTPPATTSVSPQIRLNPNSPGIRASTMVVMPAQNILPEDPKYKLRKWGYSSTW